MLCLIRLQVIDKKACTVSSLGRKTWKHTVNNNNPSNYLSLSNQQSAFYSLSKMLMYMSLAFKNRKPMQQC